MDAIRDSCEELLTKMSSTVFAPPFAIENQILALCLLSSASIQFRAAFLKNQNNSQGWVALPDAKLFLIGSFGSFEIFSSPLMSGRQNCVVAYFWGGISSFWPYLVEVHEKKRGTILKILPWSLKFRSLYKLVAVKTFNVFLSSFWSNNLRFWYKKSHYFSSKCGCELHCCCVENGQRSTDNMIVMTG